MFQSQVRIMSTTGRAATRTGSPNSQSSSSKSFGGRAPGNAARKSQAQVDSTQGEQEDTPNQV